MINRTSFDHLFWIMMLALFAMLGIKIAGIAVVFYLAVLVFTGRKIK